MIRVMVVDDSPLFRRVLSDLLNKDPEIGEVTTAANGEMALNKLERHQPDVITMDLEMPGMGGLETIAKIMSTRPIPIVVISGAARGSAERSLKAIELGAIDVIEKTGQTPADDIGRMKELLAVTVKNAAKVRPVATGHRKARTAPAESVFPAGARQSVVARQFDIVAIGASTGGPTALKEVLLGLPANFPTGIAVVQHMPAGFTSAYAKRLNTICPFTVREAADGDAIGPGTVLIAPGDIHIRLEKKGNRPVVILDRSEKVNKHRPSVDVLMSSVAENFGRRALGIIMTGMGRDGARGIREVHSKGGYVIAQDEASSVIYGMNRAVVEEKSCDEVVALGDIAGRLIHLSTRRPTGQEKK